MADEAEFEVTEDADEATEQFLDDDVYDEARTTADAKALEVEALEVGAINEVQDEVFEEIKLPPEMVADVQATWAAYIKGCSSREAAGDALFAALFESAPSLQSLFKTPRAVMAMRFMNGLNSIVTTMHDPSALKIITETLGFQHLDMEVTVARVIIFRDAIVDLLEMELGYQFTSRAKVGWKSIFNYVGGAFIYVRLKYADRLKIITRSWATANKKAQEVDEEEEDGEGGPPPVDGQEMGGQQLGANSIQKKSGSMMKSGSNDSWGSGEKRKHPNAMQVPTTFNEMFLFNGAVMGFGNSLWMHEVLASFDAIVTNVSNSYRLQEECDTLALNIAKYKGTVVLSEFKAVMLASLRSLVPKDWNSAHEVAWTWLWENVERMVKALAGKPQVQAQALERFLMSLTEDSRNVLRKGIYSRFFALAPAGQDYFKQSTTRLYFLADKVVDMTIEMYHDPKKMVEDISALGLRHVGYGIPTELFAPYVSGAVEVVRTMTSDDNAEDGFRWSLSLISRILVRTINEGSTVVMRAINTNSAKQLNKAVSCAPRGKRAMFVLSVSVGTQSISPFYWAIESGSMDSAHEMLVDLLTIRADRDNYYFGADDLFERHPEVIERLCADAPALLPFLMDGLVWRSRTSVNQKRRVNYYVKHLIQDADGDFDLNLKSLVDAQDPKIICHPVVVLFSDIVWSRLANRQFLLGKCWFLFSLILFVISQSVLQHLNEGEQVQDTRNAIFACRVFIYLGSLGQLVVRNIKDTRSDFRAGRTVKLGGCVRIPAGLTTDWQKAVAFALMLVLMFMLSQEPILCCLSHYDADAHASSSAVAASSSSSSDPSTSSSDHRLLEAASGAAASAAQAASAVINHDGDLFTQHCVEGEKNLELYAPACMLAMVLYWTLLIDLTAFSTRVSAFVLVCFRVVSELGLSLMAIAFLILSFASAISSLSHEDKDFKGIPKGALSLIEMTLGMFPSGHYQTMQDEPVLLVAVGVYSILAMIFLLNLLVAQLNGAYQTIYQDMIGLARLNRGKIIVETMETVSHKRWARFLDSLKLDERLEFNEGDVGFAGGIQVLEPANVNPTTIDQIQRFGGSTSPAMLWPEVQLRADEDEKFERLEKVILRATKKWSSGGGTKGKHGGSSGLSSSQGQSSSQSGTGSRKSGSGSEEGEE